MVTLLLIVLIIGLLILVHEWGHFYAARRLGIRVDEFGIGFPPRLFSRMRNGVRYSLNLLPFGGFVKIFGEHGEGEGEGESFISRPAWQRLAVLAAGVFMNFGLAWLFFSIGAAVGVPQVVEKPDDEVPVSIITVLPGSPAAEAGLHFGDQILEMRAREISLRSSITCAATAREPISQWVSNTRLRCRSQTIRTFARRARSRCAATPSAVTDR